MCADAQAGVRIDEPKIHAAVFERIAENTTGYAPAGLPATYRVVDEHGGISDLDPPAWEDADGRRGRDALLERAQDHVFWRRVLYYLLAAVTLALALMPYYRPAIPGAEPDGWAESLLSMAFGWLPALLPGAMGSSAGWWTDAWTQSVFWFLALALICALLLGHSRWIDGNIHRLSEVAWWHVKRCPQPRPPTPGVGFFERLAGGLRHTAWLQSLRWLTIRWLAPALTLVAVACILVGATYRIAFDLSGAGSGLCSEWLAEHDGEIPAHRPDHDRAV